MTSITVTKENALDVVSFILASIKEKSLHIQFEDSEIEEGIVALDLLPAHIQQQFHGSLSLGKENIHHV